MVSDADNLLFKEEQHMPGTVILQEENERNSFKKGIVIGLLAAILIGAVIWMIVALA